jgi:hypothetical protein
MWRMRQCANGAPNADLSTCISVYQRALACISPGGMSVHQWCTNDAVQGYAPQRSWAVRFYGRSGKLPALRTKAGKPTR